MSKYDALLVVGIFFSMAVMFIGVAWADAWQRSAQVQCE